MPVDGRRSTATTWLEDGRQQQAPRCRPTAAKTTLRSVTDGGGRRHRVDQQRRRPHGGRPRKVAAGEHVSTSGDEDHAAGDHGRWRQANTCQPAATKTTRPAASVRRRERTRDGRANSSRRHPRELAAVGEHVSREDAHGGNPITWLSRR